MEGVGIIIVGAVIAMILLCINAARIDNKILKSRYDMRSENWDWD